MTCLILTNLKTPTPQKKTERDIDERRRARRARRRMEGFAAVRGAIGSDGLLGVGCGRMLGQSRRGSGENRGGDASYGN